MGRYHYWRLHPFTLDEALKVYFYDNGDVLGDEGAMFENLIAATLIKRRHFLEDRDGYRYDLRYIRDKEVREVDFAIFKEGELIELIESKYADENISRSLVYYAQRLNPQKATQIVAKLKRPYASQSTH